MAEKNIQIRPKGSGDYSDVLHPETNAGQVKMSGGGTLQTAFDSHKADNANPHNVTKTQVGLGSVLNYGIATQAEAEAGTSSTKYMTPQRTAQAIAVQADAVQTSLDSHKADNAAHNATSAATANSIILRDEFGRAKVAAPSEGDDIVRLDTLADYAKVFRGGKKIQSGTMSSSGSSSGSGYYRKDFSASFSAGFTNSSSIVICVTPKFKFGLGVTTDSKLLWGVRTVATNIFYFSIEVSAESYLDYISSNGLFYIAIGN